MNLRTLRWLAPIVVVACGGPAEAAGPPDAPLPPGEPTAEVRLKVDLRPSSHCEQSFDLELYADRSIHLVRWDGAAGSCAGRRVTIVYLPRRTQANDVIARARRLAERAETDTP